MSKTESQKKQDALAWALLLFLSLVWGSSFILIKKALIAFTPIQVGAGRVAIAFLAFLPLLLYQFRQLDWSKFFPLLVVGLCGSGIPAFLYAAAQTEISSGVAGILNALTPIFAFLLALMFFGQTFSWKQLAGITLGLLGTSIIFLSKTEGNASFPFLYGLMIVVATFCYGISANTVSNYLKGVHPLIISTVSFSMIGPWLLIYLLQTDFISVVTTHEYGMQSFGALMVLSLVGTFGANILFFKLIQITDAVFSSSVSFLTPVVALMWGFLDGEYFSVHFFLALILIFAGVFLVKFKGK